MPLNTAQQQAVEYLDGPLLVLAGPGTGKTQLLSAKVAYILEHTNTNPENILCLTFTEAGASNMRARLLSMIGKAGGQVNIHTYHAFGSDLLAQYQNYATEFDRALTEPIDTVTQFKIISDIQSHLPATDILRGDNVSDIISTISSAKSARLSGTDLRTIAQTNIEQSALLNSAISPLLTQLVPRMKYPVALTQVYSPIREVLATFITEHQPPLPNIETEATTLLRDLNAIIEEQNASDKPSVTKLTAWKNANFELDAAGNYRLKNVVANKKLLSLATIMTQYDDYLRANGLFDFPDMIEQAIHTLKTDRGFQLTLEERYQYILLDEFQDTNPSQFELIRLISDYERPNIMAVGDDDQAIFEFQGANVSNMLDFQQLYQAHVITLTENYRSTQEILDFSHHIADQIDDSFAKQRNITKTLTSVRNSELSEQASHIPTASLSQSSILPDNSHPSQSSATTNSTHIYRHEFLSADTEYYWVAAQIQQLIQHGVSQSDIAIITPKHKYIAPLLPYLKAHPDINIAYEKRENILEDSKIHQLATLARFIQDAANLQEPAHRLLEILSFPFWQISPLAVINAINEARLHKRNTLDTLAQSSDPQLQRAAQFLAQLITLSFDSPLEQMLDWLTGAATLPSIPTAATSDYSSTNPSIPTAATSSSANPSTPLTSPFLTYYTAQPDYQTYQLYENLSVLREKIKSHTKNPTPKLQDFVNFLDDYEAAGEAVLNTSPYQDSANAVQIVTAHKSKGLEYPYVFLVAVDNISWGKAKGNNNTLTLPKNLIQIRHTGITDNERLRLFFVAITRAEHTLIMTNSITDFAGKSPDRLSYLQEAEDSHTGQPISPFLTHSQIITHYQDLPANQKQQAIHTQWLSAYQTITPELRPILQKQLENYQLTATDITSFIDLVYAGPMSFYQTRILHAPSEPYNTTISFGNLMHATYEAITKQKLDDAAALDFYKQRTLEEPLTEKDRQDLLEKGALALEVSLQHFGQLLRQPTSQAEVNLHHEHIMLGDIPITGKIDHLAIDETNKTIEIYDYKTSHFHDAKWQSHATLYKYALQLGFYKLLLNNSPTYRKYTVTKGHILFVNPDSADHLVHDKIYEYNPADEAELIALATAIYRHVKALDFLDNPQLALYPDEHKGLKDIKAFVQLLTLHILPKSSATHQ